MIQWIISKKGGINKMYTHKIKEGHIPTKRNKTGRYNPNKGKTLEEMYGKEKALEIKKKLSEQKRGNKNPAKRQEVKNKISKTAKENFKNGNRKLSNNSMIKHGGKRSDLDDQYFRSAWEADFARVLNYENIEYIYEQKIILSDCTYYPDFYLPKYNMYFEIKANNGDIAKYVKFKNEKNEQSYIIYGKEFIFLSKLYSYKIQNWESKKYYFESYNKNSKSPETTCWKVFLDYLKNA